MRYICALLLVFSTTLVAQNARKSPGGTLQISGVVVSANSGQPLPRTRVALTPVNGTNAPASIVTGSDGRFAFDRLAAGKYALSAVRAGFPPQSFDQHEFFSTAIAVGIGLKSTGLIFRLKPEAVITGTVRDEADEPVRDASVILFHRALENGRLTTHRIKQEQTDDQGEYRFGQLPEGNILIAVRARPWYAQTTQVWNNGQPVSPNADLDVAYPLVFYPGVTEDESAAPIQLHSGDQVSADFVLRAVPSARLNIQQVNADPAHPISAALTQQLFDSTEYVQTQNMFHDNTFAIYGFAPGQYTLRLNMGAGDERDLDLNITSETTIQTDSIPEFPKTKVSGILQVEGLTGSPGKAIIQMEQQSPRHFEQAQVSSDGTFEMPQVPSGTYEVKLFNLSDTFLQNVNGPGAKGRFVKIAGSSDVSLQVIASKGAGKITGTVMNGDHTFAGAMVVLVPDNMRNDGSLVRRDQSDSDGTFTLSNVVPGNYRLLAIIDGWNLNWLNPAVLAPYLSGGEAVTVTRGSKLDFKVAAQKK